MHHFLIIQNNSAIVIGKKKKVKIKIKGLGRENWDYNPTTTTISENNREFKTARCFFPDVVSDDTVKWI